MHGVMLMRFPNLECHCTTMTGMLERPRASIGEAIRSALDERDMSQSDLARALPADAGLISKWINGHQSPGPANRRRLKEVLGLDLGISRPATRKTHELYVAAPITGLANGNIAVHHAEVSQVVAAARRHVPDVYWPGEVIHSTEDLVAPDIATEHNLDVLAKSQALIYLQFDELDGPSGALVELGIGLGRRVRTTIILREGLRTPFLLREGFGAVAARHPSMPKARIYLVSSAAEAASLIERNGRELLGLA